MSVLDNLNRIKSCKDDIKQALTDRGVDMTDVAFTEYATKINEIPAGGGDYLDMRANMSTYYSTAESLPEYAFAYCQTLQSVNLPMCKRVGSRAFNYCSSLLSIDLPKCTNIYSSAFYSCYSLSSVNLPNLPIMTDSFGYCSSLTELNLPKCSKIDWHGCANISNLTMISIPKCYVISGYAFLRCAKLPAISIPHCYIINELAFSECSSLSVLDLRSAYSCALSNSNAFSKTLIASGIGSIYVHNTVLSQFQNATNWVYFSDRFVGVGDPTRPLLAFDNGRLYGDAGILNYHYSTFLSISKNSITSIDLPYCVAMINNFSSCTSLQSVNLPMCSYVGSSAFYDCSSLTSISLPMCGRVSDSAFGYCTSLQSVNLPMCSYVGSDAFRGCSSLQSVNLPMCEYVCEYAFCFCSSLQSVNLPMCSYVGSSAFYNCKSLQSVNLPMCSYVSARAFMGCSSLTTISLPMCSYLNYTIFDDNLKTLYIGTSLSTVCVLKGEIALNNFKYISSIFVPMSLVDAYKTAPNWSLGASKIFGI